MAQQKSPRVNPRIFFVAAEYLQRRLNNGDGITCCDALQYATNVATLQELRETAEYKLFKRLYCKKRSVYELWFGTSEDAWGRPKQKNQAKRLRALNKTFAVASASIKKEKKRVRNRK